MAPSVEAVVENYEFDARMLQRVSARKVQEDLHIVEPDPEWPAHFERLRRRIATALGAHQALAVTHVGSTSVPGLPAKAVIDIDLTVPDPTDEAAYAGALEAAGFQLLVREPRWHEHRLFVCYTPVAANLHVWGPDCPEATRHRIFTAWLRRHAADRELYARTKREASEQSLKHHEKMQEYNIRKQGVVRDILARALAELGYL